MEKNIPISLNGGVFVRQVDYNTVKGHLDSSNVFEFFGNNKDVTNFGMVDFYATSGYMPTQASRLGSVERKFLDTHEFTYSYPTAQKEFYIVEDLSATDKAGISGSSFRIKMNHRKYDNLWVITPDPQLPVSLLITEDEIERDGDGWIYTVRMRGEGLDGKFWKKEFLAPGTKYFCIGTTDGEYNQTRSLIPEFSGGERQFASWVGYDGQQLHYSITREAAKSTVPNKSMVLYDQFMQTLQTYKFNPGTLGYELSLMTPEQKQSFNGDVTEMYRKSYGPANAERQMAKDSLLNLWASKVEMLGIQLLNQMVDTTAYFGSGGTYKIDGVNEVKSALGLFHQYMLGNTSNYNIGLLTKEFLETIVESRLVGKQQYSPDQAGPEVVLKTGKGGLGIVHKFIEKLPAQAGLLWSTEGIIKGIGGDNRRLGFDAPRFDRWVADSGIRYRVVYEPSLDPISANPIINPIVPLQSGVGGHHLSSYIFIIEDLAANNDSVDGGSNVYELFYRPDWEMRKSYTNGKLAYPGSEDANGNWHRQPGIPGFEVTLELRNKAFWLKDPTRSLVLKPNNPFTGKPIFEYR